MISLLLPLGLGFIMFALGLGLGLDDFRSALRQPRALLLGLLAQILLLPLTAAITYFTVYFLIPRYLFQKDYRRFLLFSFYMVSASAYFIVLMIYGVLIFY